MPSQVTTCDIDKDSLEEQFQLDIDFMEYLSLRTAVPAEWKRKLRERSPILPDLESENKILLKVNEKQIDLKSLRTKGIYKIFQNQQIHTPSAVLKWNEDLGADIQKWEQYFLLPYKITRTVYLQNFQFCPLHRIIPHGTLLYKMNINTHDICSLCEHERDTILHDFLECVVTASLWRESLVERGHIH